MRLCYEAILNSGVVTIKVTSCTIQNIINLEYIIYYGGNTDRQTDVFYFVVVVFSDLVSFINILEVLLLIPSYHICLCVWGFFLFVSMMTRKNRLLQIP